MGKLTDAELQARKDRQRVTATLPKCGCGNVVGKGRWEAGVKQCSACLPDATLDLLRDKQRRFMTEMWCRDFGYEQLGYHAQKFGVEMPTLPQYQVFCATKEEEMRMFFLEQTNQDHYLSR